jgi:hypothetical protein
VLRFVSYAHYGSKSSVLMPDHEESTSYCQRDLLEACSVYVTFLKLVRGAELVRERRGVIYGVSLLSKFPEQ